MSESLIERRLKRAVKEVKGRCIKLPALWYRGIPDRLILLPGGRVWFIELKKEKAQTEKAVAAGQSAWAIYLLKYGFNYARLVGRSGVDQFIQEHVNDSH